MTVVRTGKVSYSGLVEQLTPYNEMLRFSFVTGAWTLDDTLGLIALSSEADRQALMVGYANAFVLFTLVCFATLPLLALVRLKRADAGGGNRRQSPRPGIRGRRDTPQADGRAACGHRRQRNTTAPSGRGSRRTMDCPSGVGNL